MQQRRAQSITDNAHRIEGHRRAAMFRSLKEDKHTDMVRKVYQDYAKILRSDTKAKQSAD